MNPPLEEVRPTFREWMSGVEFCFVGVVFGMLDCGFGGEWLASAVATVALGVRGGCVSPFA